MDTFFVLDRKTGKNLLTTRFVYTNWATDIDAKGSPIPNPAKEPQPDGVLVKGAEDGGTSWMAPSFDPETGLFYVNAWRGDSFWYLAVGKDNLPKDHQGGGALHWSPTPFCWLWIIRRGKFVGEGERQGLGSAGILTTAGHLLFTADASGNLLALDPSDGHVLWHTRPGGIVDYAAPMTYKLTELNML